MVGLLKAARHSSFYWVKDRGHFLPPPARWPPLSTGPLPVGFLRALKTGRHGPRRGRLHRGGRRDGQLRRPGARNRALALCALCPAHAEFPAHASCPPHLPPICPLSAAASLRPDARLPVRWHLAQLCRPRSSGTSGSGTRHCSTTC